MKDKVDQSSILSEPNQDSQQDYSGLIERTEATRWQSGQSGNPNGRPKATHSITWQLKEKLKAEGGKKAGSIADKAISEAENGSHQYFKEILDRTDGKLGDVTINQDERVFNLVVTEDVASKLMEVSGRVKGGSDAIERQGDDQGTQQGEDEEIPGDG